MISSHSSFAAWPSEAVGATFGVELRKQFEQKKAVRLMSHCNAREAKQSSSSLYELFAKMLAMLRDAQSM
jgi:hypothetical protein